MMKTQYLPILLLTLVLTWYATPMIHAAEPPTPPHHTDITQPPPFTLDDELVEPQGEPDSIPSDPSLPPVVQSSTNWHVETVDSAGDVGAYTSLALDGNGHPHISYIDSANVNLKYAWYDGTDWHIETVDSEGYVGAYTSLALDAAGHPHISYLAGSYFDCDLKYAWHNGTNWHIETVDSEGAVGEYTSLALDAAGRPHISYFGLTNEDLKYAWHDGTSWHIEIVDGEERVGWHTSLALDAAGHPHISYQGGSDLKYARHDGTIWHIETVDSEGHVGRYTSLALDAAGHPHISYSDYNWMSGSNLKYAWHDGASWHIETVDSEGGVGYDTSLALDESGHPHISYLGNGVLKYTRHDGTNWRIETVDSEWSVGHYTSLALDGSGYPHISYFDYGNTNLKYAWQLPFSLEKQVAPSDSLDDVSALTHTLAYSLTLSGDGGDFRLWDALPDGVSYVPGSINNTLAPPAVYSPTLDAVIWRGTLPTNTIQTVNFQVVLEITSTRFLTVPRSIVNTARLTDVESDDSATATATVNVLPPPISLSKQVSIDGSRLYNHDLLTYTLALSGSGLNVRLWDPLPPGVHYVSGTLTGTLTPPAIYSPTARAIAWEGTSATDTIETLRFQVTADVGGISDENPSPVPLVNTAWLTATESGRSVTATASIDVMIPPSSATNWFIETVDSQGDVGGDTSLALDGSGHPHISYLDYTNSALKYAWHKETGWYVETVDSEGGRSSSLTLDGTGLPHISYFDISNDNLKYAWHDGTTWHIETVDSEGPRSRATSLAMDGTGHPHISYVKDYLHYAWYDGASWHTETVDSEWGVSECTSLALDGSGHPHISYSSGTIDLAQLKYAWHDGANWHIETVDSEGDVGQYSSLALDGAGHPHITYYDHTNNDLKYAWYDGTTWHTETVDSEGWVGWYSSLALDGAGHPHVSYGGTRDLKYAWHDGTNWQIETVDSEGDTGYSTSLALDGDGRPHISYRDSTNDDLKYALQSPFSLDKQVTSSDSPDDVNALTHTLTYSLTLVGPGLNVRLQDPLPDHVHYVLGSITSTLTPPAVYSPTLDAVIWDGVLLTDTVQTVYFQVTPEITSTRFLSEPLSITNVAWMDDLDYDRRVLDTAVVTIEPPPLVLRKRATPIHGLRNNGTLTYTLTLYGPGLRARLWDPLPSSVRYVSGSLTDTIGSISGTLTLPAAVYSPTAHAILWEGTLPTDTVEMIRFQATPGITGAGSLSLSLPIVNTAWLTATESGRSVSATAIVNGDYYVYLPLTLRDD